MFAFITAALLVNLPLAFSPGPANILCLSVASAKGFKGSLKFIAGLQVLPFLYSLIIAFGAGYFLTQHAYITHIVKILGSIYMLYLAFCMLRSDSDIKKKPEIKSSFSFGVMAQALNPKNIAIILTIYSLFSVETQDYHFGIVLAFIITLCNFLSHLLWASSAQLILKSPLSKYQDKFFGALLVLATALLWI